ncbi:class I SAM-dependent methyltransferase [Actinoplanes sp. N902-109]|uniref:class I SAM-dependent methyltransferase n=1 Tax=Actinoplanes sp. (strain N902-109) TaxID=649831 RepID=UPI0003294CD8|nr:class I SAM-dependent methyltransferase [Actinoplanes sp. N902-109]AGL12170.2 methyltransferase [Actinoplanes sp. N902-109]AGL16482.1 SAM-dependent methyltransferase [Actinoplanes sp. N902-109]
MDAEFYTRVADRFGGYFSNARSTDIFPDGRPDDAFDELVNALGAPDARLVDIGCADGRRLLANSRAYGTAIGLDLSPSMLDVARRYRADAGLAHVTFELRDAAHTGLPDGYADVLTSRRGPLFAREFERVVRPGGAVFYMGIGEQDARELKESIGRGQDYGSWNGTPLAERAAHELSDAGFVEVRSQAFRFEEFYHSPADLDTFLQQVPIVEDYDPVADQAAFDRYVAAATGDRGIRLSRHWFIVRAQKLSH